MSVSAAQREAFVEASRELAESLGQLPVRVSPYECYIPSRTVPGKIYRMAWAPVSGWVHADSTCPSYKECWHRKEAENMTSLVVRNASGAALAERPVLLVEYDAQALSAGVDPAIAAKWAYNLPGGGGQGVGVRGAEEGVRAMASHGEVIRVDSVELVREDDREAFFMATASRYVVSPDGAVVRLDSQTRGKRVPKWDRRSDGSAEYFVKAWFEIGIAKAARNAALAMMPSNVKSAILEAGLDAAAGVNSPQQRQAAPARRRAPQQGNASPTGADAMTKFWQDAKALGLNTDVVIARSQALFDNREPIKLTAQERIDLLAKMAQEKLNAVAPEHACEMKFDEGGNAICGVCGQPADEATGKHATQQPAFAV